MSDFLFLCPMCQEARFDWDYNESEEICDTCYEKRMKMLKKAYVRIKQDEFVAA